MNTRACGVASIESVPCAASVSSAVEMALAGVARNGLNIRITTSKSATITTAIPSATKYGRRTVTAAAATTGASAASAVREKSVPWLRAAAGRSTSGFGAQARDGGRSLSWAAGGGTAASTGGCIGRSSAGSEADAATAGVSAGTYDATSGIAAVSAD